MSDHVTEWLNAYFDGELTGGRLRQVEEHLAGCETCQTELESLQGLSGLLHEIPLPEFKTPERFATQVNLLLPQKPIATPSNKLVEAGWWMIPVGLLAAWAFVGTASLVSSLVSVANNIGVLDGMTSFFVSGPSNTAWTSALGQFGVMEGNSLQWFEATESYSRNLLPQFVWQVAIAILYLVWMAVWWARRTRQPQVQPVEG